MMTYYQDGYLPQARWYPLTRWVRHPLLPGIAIEVCPYCDGTHDAPVTRTDTTRTP